jgi:lipopolysaccharide transport protein LptA
VGMIPTNAFSAKSKDKLKKSQENKPIEIQSDKLRSENEGKKFIFSGNVLSNWGDLEIKSDILEVYANPKSKVDRKKATEDVSQAGQDLDKIIAIGNVDIKKGDRRAKGDRAHYDNKKQIIVITGEPSATAWEGENIIKGKKMTFILEEDLFKVEGRVILVLNPKNPPPEKKR